MLLGLQDAELDGPGGTQRIGEWADWITAAVAAVVQPELDAARAENEHLHQQLAALVLAAEDVHTQLHTLIVNDTAPGSAARAAWTDLDAAMGPLRATAATQPAT